MNRIYLSGPMTGIENMNFPEFNAEADRLRKLGYDVVNPAEIDQDSTDWCECMRKDLAELLTCDTLALLQGWHRSAGAHLEMHVASIIGMEIVMAQEIV